MIPYIFYTNAGGLLNKLDELKNCLLTYSGIDIICITETHLNKSVLDAEISINGYKFYRKDRDFDIHKDDIVDFNCDGDNISGGGGSIIYYKETLKPKLVEMFYKKAPDSLAIELDSNIGKFCIACVYRSPNLSCSLNHVLLSCLNDICSESNLFETFLVGDFNLPDISWDTGNLKHTSITNNFTTIGIYRLI